MLSRISPLRHIRLSLTVAATCLALGCSSSGPDKPSQSGTGGSSSHTGGAGGTGNAGGSTAGAGGMGGVAVLQQTCVPFADMNQPIQMLSQTGCVNETN